MPQIQRIVFSLAFLCPCLWAAGPTRRPIDVENYRIRLALDPALDPDRFDASVEIKLKATAPITQLTLDRRDLTVDRITSAGKKLRFDASNPEALVIALPRRLSAGKAIELTIQYHGLVRSAHDGFFKVRDPDEPARGPLFFTMFEATSAREFYPCNDEPFDKATTETIVTVPVRYTVVSNGRLVSDRKLKRGAADWHEVHWKLDRPHSTYLLSLAIAPLTKISAEAGKKEVSIYVGATKADAARFALESTTKSILFYEKYLNTPYPWPKYSQIGIPTFLWGGMENTSATHMNQERLLLNDPQSEQGRYRITGLVAHELAHQWFGDFVTMHWWEDVWLNESFASLMATRATSDYFKNEEAEIEARLSIWDSYFRQEDGPRSHPIVNHVSGPDDGFDSISYDKGENVLRMLSYHIGEEKFRLGLSRYLGSHAYGNATNEDLFAAMEAASGENLAAFRQSWLLQRGYPIVRYDGMWEKSVGAYRLVLRQIPNHPEDKTLFHFRLPVTFHRKQAPAYTKRVVIAFDQPEIVTEIRLTDEPEWISVNPSTEVLAKIEPLSRDEDALLLQARQDDEPLARVWANYQLLQGLIDGKEISRSAQKGLLETLRADPSPYVRMAVLQGIQRMKARWLPSRLGEGLMEISRALLEGKGETALIPSDRHGWTSFRAQCLASLGKVEGKETVPYLSRVLAKADLPLDDLTGAAHALAMTGDDRAEGILNEAADRHAKRGYAYRFAVLYAFGAYENPKAVKELSALADSAAPDYWGHIGWAVVDNQTLKRSAEWAAFLKQFILTNQRLGEEVKARLLETVEDVKEKPVEQMLRALVKESKSDRIKEAAKKTLEKNFKG